MRTNLVEKMEKYNSTGNEYFHVENGRVVPNEPHSDFRQQLLNEFREIKSKYNINDYENESINNQSQEIDRENTIILGKDEYYQTDDNSKRLEEVKKLTKLNNQFIFNKTSVKTKSKVNER